MGEKSTATSNNVDSRAGEIAQSNPKLRHLQTMTELGKFAVLREVFMFSQSHSVGSSYGIADEPSIWLSKHCMPNLNVSGCILH